MSIKRICVKNHILSAKKNRGIHTDTPILYKILNVFLRSLSWVFLFHHTHLDCDFID